MRVTICLDTDGTVESSNGPVTRSLLEHLESAGAHIGVVSVSPSHLKNPDGSPRFENISTPDLNQRHQSLRRFREKWPADLYLYVDDLESNRPQAELAGFVFIFPWHLAALKP